MIPRLQDATNSWSRLILNEYDSCYLTLSLERSQFPLASVANQILAS